MGLVGAPPILGLVLLLTGLLPTSFCDVEGFGPSFIDDVVSGVGLEIQLEATSTDPNSTVIFTLIEVTNGQGDYVTLNSTGYLTIDPLADTSFFIDLTVEDSEETVEELIYVDITDGVDDAPTFSQDTYSFSLREDASDGHQIGTIDASDDEGTVTVAIGSSETTGLDRDIDEIFGFLSNSETLVLLDTNSIDRESVSTIRFTVVATDSASQTATADVTIVITDANDETPVITNDGEYELIIQTTPTGTEVFDVEATDDDEVGINSDLTFELTNFTTLFAIDELSGEITINGSLEATTYYIGVNVSDDGSTSLSSTGVFILEVAPANDAAPEFIEPFEFSITENTAPEDAVFTFNVTDEDSGDEGTANLTLSATQYSQNFSLEFNIIADSTTAQGELFLLSPFDRESLANFTLTVVATDSGYVDYRKTSSQVFSVTVLDTNDNTPIFTDTPYSQVVAEDRTDGHIVFTVSATDSDTGTNSELEFSLIEDFDGLFAINSTSGEVSVEGTLHKATRDNYSVEILVKDGGDPELNSTTTLNITVEEVNDNAPFFTEPSEAVTIELAEDVETGYVLLNISTDDDDTGLAGEVLLSLSPNSSPFAIENETLILNTTLDYESSSEYEVFIVASDRGDPVLSASVQVTVTIDDVNEFAPVFQYPEDDFPDGTYTVSTLSTARAGTVLLTVEATDADGRDNDITYNITYITEDEEAASGASGDNSSTPTQEPEIFTFSINADGEISNDNLFPSVGDSENISYAFVVVATDNGNPETKNTSAEVTIVVFSPDNHFNPILDEESYQGSVDENEGTGIEVVSFSITDGDQGTRASQLGKIEIHGSDSDYFTTEITSSTTGRILTNSVFDYEEKNEYELILVATDNGLTPRQSQPATVTITINNLNDNVPEFDSASYSFSVAESLSVGVSFGSVSATDKDELGEIVYTLADNSEVFKIDNSTGDLSLVQTLDFETKQTYTITVEAVEVEDGEELAGFGNTTVNVTVTNANDHAPEFIATPYEFTVLENATIGSTLGTVNANDSDSSDSDISFSIEGDVFDIDSSSGVISVAQTLDRETIAQYTLTITASDNDEDDPLETNVTVAVEVGDVNDNSPVFPSVPTSFRVSESNTVGSYVAMIRATDEDDPDSENSEITYDIVGGSGADYFQIDSSTGNLTLESSLDYEQNTSFELVIEATDGGVPALNTNKTFTIRVGNEDDNEPLFIQDVFSFSIKENNQINDFIGQIQATDLDPHNRTIGYRFATPQPTLFSVNRTTGNITARLVYNLESLDTSTEEFIVQTFYQDDISYITDSATVYVTIEDENEFPVVVQDIDNIEIYETQNVSDVVGYVEATDADANSSLRYTIFVDADILEINSTSGAISVATAIDRESSILSQRTCPDGTDNHISCVRFSVRVSDQTSGDDKLEIGVLLVRDLDDEPPEFSQNSYTYANLSENEETGFELTDLDLSASDPDIGISLTYAIPSDQDIDDFSIERLVARISVAESLDYERNSSYNFSITATDTKGNIGSATVVIEIFDENDNAPVFVRDIFTRTISEDSDVGLEVVTVNATDADSTSNAELTYNITDGNVGDKFAIDADTGLVTLADSINREEVSFYSLTIEAVDGGDIPLTGSVLLNISISDIDDHAPFFVKSSFTGEVIESADIGDSVLDSNGNPLQLTVNDLDIGSEVSITSFGTNVPFSVDESTGNVTVAGTLNANLEQEYEFLVVAQDNTDLYSAPASVTITVLSETQHPPEFEEDNYRVTIEENADEGEIIEEVVATDQDSGDSVSYSIQSSFNASDFEPPEMGSGSNTTDGDITFPFEIDAVTGEITLLRKLDYETAPKWEFNITATDEFNNSAVVIITVDVEDLNDNAPRFVNHSFRISINEDTAVSDTDSVSDAITARDADSISEGSLRYYIISGASGHFEMDRKTGKLFLTSELDRNEVASYELEVVVSDGDNEDTAIVEIIVVDTNNHRPSFTEDDYNFSLLENATNGTFVGQVDAEDDDVGVFGSITYSILDGGDSSIFSINSSTGEIFTETDSFDAETSPYSYLLTVEGTDGGTPPLSSNASVEITVSDVNDNSPQFTVDPFSFSVDEDADIDDSVFQVTASDSDSGSNKELEFEVLKPNGSFSIDSETGIVRVASELDFDNPDSPNPIIVQIIVNDRGSPSLSTRGTLNITIADVNDNSPYFEAALIQEYVAENTSVNETAFTAIAFDDDSNENAELSYEILDATPAECVPRYRIEAETGNVILNEPVDAEEREVPCAILIQVTDNGQPSLSSTATFNVLITDTNEAAPVFVPARPTGSIAENSVGGTTVLTLQTTDGDGDFVRYRAIGGATRQFDVSFTGIITVASGAELDRETEDEYVLLIQARDDGGPRMSTETTVTITVTDENDNPPVFDQSDYYLSVRESLGLDDAFGTIVASDLDIGTNDDIEYSLTDNGQGETDFGKFAITPDTGEIFLIEQLDYETEDHYYLLKVTADDDVFNTTTTVHIRVLESNDITPTFNNLPGSTELAEDAVNGTTVFNVSASDNDHSVNGKITYSLKETEGSDKFSIHPDTGVIVVSGNNQFDFDAGEQTYKLTVVAMDNAMSEPSGDNDAASGSIFGDDNLVNSNDEVLSNTSTLIINITDVNDNAPLFTEDLYSPVVVEHDGVSLTVITVTATDADEPDTPNSEINYDILSGSFGRFEVEPNGDIITVLPISREVQQVYNLLVIAYDNGEPSLNSTTNVTVMVHDSDDERPVFTQTRYTGSIEENSPEPVSILEVRAIDMNTIENRANYSLVESNASVHFTINTTSGVIYTSDEVIDREENLNFTFVVIAGDINGLYSTAEIFIRVTDENDERPIFEELEYSFNVSENQAVGTRLRGVKATDRDSGSNAVTVYELELNTGRSGLFEIDSENGDIVVEIPPCFSDNSTDRHTFTLYATDNLNSSLRDTAFLTISLYEENRHPPEFVQPSYVSRLESLALEDTEVLPSIQTTDKDVCSGDPVFEIVDGNDNDTFVINSTTGQILLARNLTADDLSFTLIVRATDTGNFEVSDLSATVSIVVLVGQLLPVSVSVEPGLKSLLTSRVTQFSYVQNIWLHDSNGSPANTSPNVTFSLGSLSEEAQIPVNGAVAESVDAALARTDVYPDDPEIYVGVQVEGPNYGRASVEATEVFIQVVTESNSVLTGSCVTRVGTGTCVASITVPSTWFTSGGQNVSIYYGLNEGVDTYLGEVTVNAVGNCNSLSSPAVSVKLPAKVIFPDTPFNVTVYPHLADSIAYFQLTFTLDDYIEFVRINWSPMDYNIQYATYENKLTVSGTYFGTESMSTGRVLGLEFQLKSNTSLFNSEILSLHCNIEYLVTDQQEQVLTNVSAYHINFDEDGSCTSHSGKILAANPTPVKLFPYTSTTGILNTAFLNGEEVRVEIVPHGLLSSGELTDFLGDLECESEDDSILKVDSSCQFVYLSGNETSGSKDIEIKLHLCILWVHIKFSVWFPQDIDITFGQNELNSVQGVYNEDCSNTYERTPVTVQAVFESGDDRQVATITPLVSDLLSSTDADVITLETNSDSGQVQAVGAGSGETQVTLEVNGTTITSETITVPGLSVLVDDITFVFHTGLSPLSVPQATAGEAYLETAGVELLNDPEYINQPISVLAEAVLSNGRNLLLTDENGFQLDSTNEEVFSVTSWQELSVRGGESGELEGHIDNERCENSLTFDDIFSIIVEVDLQTITGIEVTVGDQYLANSDYASIVDDLPESTKITVHLIHEDGTEVDVTDDSRTSYSSSGGISINSTGTITSSSAYGSANITVTYTYGGTEYSTTESVEVIGISGIESSSYPYPAYTGSDAVSLTTLNQYPVSGTVYQKAEIKVEAVFSNGNSLDISNSSHLSFSVSNSSVLELNGTTVVGLAPGNVIVSVELEDIENQLSFNVTDDTLNISSISKFSLNVDSDGALRASSIDSVLVPSLTIEFSDGTFYPLFLTSSGPALPGLINFTSSDPTGLPIDSESGLVEVTGNLLYPSDQYLTAQVISSSHISSRIRISEVDIVAGLGDADIDITAYYPITVNDPVEVKLYINAEDTSLGAVQLKLRYNHSNLALQKEADIGVHLPSASLFESFSGHTPGEVNIAFVTPEDVVGSERMLVATASFTVTEPEPLYFSVDVILANKYSPTIDTIGDTVPRRSDAASLRSESTTLETTTVIRCPDPPCTPSDCEDLGTTTPLGDVNADCVFDTLDVLALQIYTSRATLDPDAFTEHQLEAMDADKNGRIDLQDAEFLLSATLGRYPLIADPVLRPVGAEFSDCRLSINITLDDSFNNTFVFFGIFHTNSSFEDEYNTTEFAVGTKLSNDIPSNSYGGWSEPYSYGDGVYGIETEPGNIAQTDISFVVVYGVLGLNGRADDNRLVFLTGPPSLPLTHSAFSSEFDIFGSTATLHSDGPFNGAILFDNSFTATQCYNPNAPVFSGTGLVTVERREDVEVGTAIATVVATDADSPRRAGDIAYSLRDVTEPGTLEIDPQSGVISIAGTLDREKYGDIRATVVATDQGPHVFTRLSDTIELLVRVVDVNDNQPLADESFYSISVQEDEESDIFQFTGSDADVDYGNRGISRVAISYNGSDIDNIFRVDTTTDRNENTFTATLVLVGSLDFESRVLYNLSLEIFDNGSPTLSSDVTIELTVTDANDNRPVFLSPNTIFILENNEVGAPVLELRAEDADSGTNAEFYFEINSVHEADDDGVQIVGSSNLDGYFNLYIDNSGQTNLRAERTFDREGIHSFSLVITAREEGITSDIPAHFLWVMVCEQNDHTPEFPNFVNGTVDENSDEGTLVITVQATDDDEGPFCSRDTENERDNIVEYLLLNDEDTPFIIDRVSGNVSVNGSLDYEKEQAYVLEVVAYDLGTPSLSSSANVTISLVDLNDNPPILNAESYVTGAFENSTLDTELLVIIRATDRDSGENGVITFNLTGEGSSDFNIDPDTGVISVAVELDRDHRQAIYLLTVIAYNPNDPTMNDTAPINITVFDINDNSPTFDQPSYLGEVSENSEVGTPILTVIATDADQQSRIITYRLETSYPELFAIDNETGVVSVFGRLCVNENTTYTFEVVAEDRPVDIVTFTNTTNISILVFDDNANAPEFARPEYGGIVADGAPYGTSVLTVSASDADVCSPPFKYYITDQPSEEPFIIDENSGIIYTNSTLYQSDREYYTLRVTVFDTGSPTPKSDLANIYIVIGKTVPVDILSVEGGFPVSSPRATVDGIFEQSYDYLFDTYIGNPRSFGASYGEISSSQLFIADPLPAAKIIAKIWTPTVRYDNRTLLAAVQALDEFNSYTLADTVVYMSITYDNTTVNTTGQTTLISGSTALLSLDLPEAWFSSRSSNPSVTVQFGINEEEAYVTDSITLIPTPDFHDLCSSFTTQPQLQLQVPTYTLYRGQVFEVPLYTQLDSDNGIILTALSLRCELQPGLRFLTYPFSSDSTQFAQTFRFENYTSRSALVFTETRVEHPTSSSGFEHVGSLLIEVTDNTIDNVGISCTKYSAFSHNQTTDPFSDLLVLDKWGCHDDNRGAVTISKDKLAAVFPSLQQTVLINDVIFTGTPRYLDVVLYGYVLAAVPYPVQPNVIQQNVGVVCSSDQTRTLKAQCSGGQYEVYIDGSESEGAEAVSVTFLANSVAENFEDFVLGDSSFPVSVFVKVWFPDLPIQLEAVDETLNAVSGLLNNVDGNCIQGYQATPIKAYATFRQSGSSSTSVTFRVEHLLTLESNNNNSVAINEVHAIGKEPGVATIGAIGPDGSEIGQVNLTVVDTEIRAVEVELFHGNNLELIVPSSIPYIGSDPFQVRLNGLEFETETAELASFALFSDGTRHLVSDLVRYSLSENSSSVVELDSSVITAVESGTQQLQVDWTSCNESTVFSRSLPLPIILLTPEVRVSLDTHELALPTDAASLLDEFPTSTHLTVSLVYTISGESISIDITENALTRISFSPEESINAILNNGRYRIEPLEPNSTVSIQAFYRDFTSEVETLTIVESSELTLSARHYPLYDDAPVIDELRLIGNTGIFQKAKLDTHLFVSIPGDYNRAFDISSAADTSYTIEVGDTVSINDSILSVVSVGVRRIRAGFGDLRSPSINLNVLSREITVQSIDTLLTPVDTLSGEKNSIAARLSLGVTFSDGSKLEEAYIDGEQVVPGLFTAVFADSDIASIDARTGEVTILGNTQDLTSLTVTINDRDGRQESFEFHSNLEPAQHELDLGSDTASPVSPISLNENFSLPVYINAGPTGVCAIEVGVAYSSSLLSLDGITSGSDWTEDPLSQLTFFSSSGNEFEGFVHFGGIIPGQRSGLLHIADITFTGRGLAGVANIKAQLLNYFDSSIPPEPISHPATSPAANVHVIVGSPSELTQPDITIPVEYLESNVAVCTDDPLPCECDDGRETGDINGDCIFNFPDVVSLYHNNSLYLSPYHDLTESQTCLPELNVDYDIDGVCTINDVNFLLQASFWQAQFIPRLNVVPVNRNDCFLTIEVDLLSRGDNPGDGERTSLLIGLYDRNPAANDQYSNTVGFLGLGTKVDTTPTSYGVIPASLNGGVFLASASDIIDGRFEVKLQTDLVSEQLGLILIQVHSGFDGQVSEFGVTTLTGYVIFPPAFPEAVQATIHHPWIDVLLEWAVASPLLTIIQTVQSLVCINDNKPVFYPQITTADVYENASVGSLIAVVFANDSDSERNTIITYTINRIIPTDAVFYINETSGEVFLNSSLDREESDEYLISLHAEDQGSFGSLGGDGELVITILDINDNDPEFNQSTYGPVQILENSLTGSSVITVLATDRDLDNVIEYSLEEPLKFFINPSTGEIVIEEELDYEIVTFYALTVVATDQGGRTGTARVEIEVGPVNDNLPFCPSDISVIVPQDLNVGSIFHTISVFDVDVNTIHRDYQFSLSLPSPSFDVNKIGDTSADLILTTDTLTFDGETTYPLLIVATDRDGYECTALVTVIVGEPAAFKFELYGAGFAIGPPNQLNDSSGFEQRIAMFGNSLLQGTVTVTVGGLTRGLVYSRNIQPVSSLDGVLITPQLRYDSPFIRVAVQAKDNTFNTITGAEVSLRARPSSGEFESDTITGEPCETEEEGGSCEANVEIPQSWFTDEETTVQVWAVSGDAEQEIDSVTLHPKPSFSFAYNQTLFVQYPSYTLFPGQNFDIKIGAPYENDIIGFELNIDLGSDFLFQTQSTGQWECFIYYTPQITLTCLRGSSQPPLPEDPIFPGEIFVELSATVSTGTILTSTDFPIPTTIKSVVSKFGPESTSTPATVIDQRGISISPAILTVEPENTLDYLPYTDLAEIIFVHDQYYTLTLSAVRVTEIGLSEITLTSNFECEYNSVTSPCDQLPENFSTLTTQGSEEAIISITDLSGLRQTLTLLLCIVIVDWWVKECST